MVRADDDDIQVGVRIREMRIERGLSVTELARRCGISKSLLSQVELGSSNASVPVLKTIARQLNVPFFSLFVETDPTVTVIRKDERRKFRIPGSPIERELLTPDLASELVVVIATMGPGDVAYRNAPSSHGGVECIYVLSGTLEAELSGRRVTLNEGDSFYFNALIPHSLTNTSSAPTEIMAIVCGPDAHARSATSGELSAGKS